MLNALVPAGILILAGAVLGNTDDGREVRTHEFTVSVSRTPGDRVFTVTGLGGARFEFTEDNDYFRIERDTGEVFVKTLLGQINGQNITLDVTVTSADGATRTVILIITIEGQAMSLDGPNIVYNGSDVNFTCEGRGFAEEPEFKWLVSDIEVESDDDGRIQITNSRTGDFWRSHLLFRPILNTDQGNISCSLTSGATQATRSQILSVRGSPRVVASQERVSEDQGSDFNLTCSLDPPDIPAVLTWYKAVGDEDIALQDSKDEVTSFTLAVTGLEEETNYFCGAQVNDWDLKSDTITVTVQPTDQNTPTITLNGPTIIYNGTDVNFTCEGRGFSETPEFNWLLSGEGVEPDGAGRIEINESNEGETWISVIQFRPILSTDEGNISCGVTLGIAQASTSKEVDVRGPPSLVVRKDLFNDEGTEFILVCSLDPPGDTTVLTWYRVSGDQETVLQNSRDPVSTFQLILQGLTDDADFVCGGQVQDWELRSDVISVEGQPSVQPSPTLTLTGPHIAYNGTDVDLTCEGRDFAETPVFNWFISELEVEPNDRIQIHALQDWESVLQFRPVLTSDQGKITCSVTSGTTQASAHKDLTVSGPPTLIASQHALNDEGTDISLTCSIDPPVTPAVLTWYRVFRGEDIAIRDSGEPVTNFEMILNGIPTSADFVCGGQVYDWTLRSDVVKVVQPTDRPDPTLSLNGPTTVYNGTDVNFTCEGRGFANKPSFQWLLSEIEVESKDRLQISQPEDAESWTSVLQFIPMLLEDTGNVSCRITSGDTKVTKGQTVNVLALPELVVRKEDQGETGDFDLICSLDPPDTPIRLSWYKVVENTEIFIDDSKDAVSVFSITIMALSEDTAYVCGGKMTGQDLRSDVISVDIPETPPALLLDGPAIVYNGTDVNFTCEGRGFTEKPEFDWLLTDVKVEPNENGRIQIRETQDGETWTSVIQYRPMMSTDQGNLTCRVSEATGETHRQVIVLQLRDQPPRLAVRRDPITSEQGRGYTLNCSLDPPAEPTVLTWYKMVEDEELVYHQSTESVLSFDLTLTGIEKDTDFVCGCQLHGLMLRSSVITVGPMEPVDPDISLNGPSDVYNGTDVSYTCEGRGFNEKPRFDWLLSDEMVEPIDNRIEITESQDGEIWTSVIQFLPVLLTDKGNLSCRATTVEKQMTANKLLNVKERPQLVGRVEPGTTDQENGFVLICTMEPPDTPTLLTWYNVTRGADVELDQSDKPVSSLRLSLSGFYGAMDFVCSGEVEDLLLRSNTVTVNIQPVLDVKCPNSTDENDIMWVETIKGDQRETDCPDGFTGTVVRRCNPDGQWGDASYDTSCRRNSLNQLMETAREIRDEVFEGDLGEVLREMNDVVDPGSLTSNDVDAVLDILESITGAYNKEENTVTESDVENVLLIVDSLLSINSSTWDNLKESGGRGPKSLLQSMDDIAANAISGQFEKTIGTDTIFFQIGSAKAENIECPKLEGDFPSWLKTTQTSALLPQEAFPELKDDERMWFSSVIYRSLGSLMGNQFLKEMDENGVPGQMREDTAETSRGAAAAEVKNVVSKVMSLNVYPRMQKLTPPMYITFEVEELYGEPVCSFLNYAESNTSQSAIWSSAGCQEVSRDGYVITCACSHTTNFAILMSPTSIEPTEHEYILGIISIVGCCVSLMFLLTTVIIYCMVWRSMVKTQVARIKAVLLMNLCVSLIISYTMFLVGVRLTENKAVCTAMAALLHYLFLVVFFVMLAKGIHLFISIIIVVNTTNYLKALHIVIWATPAIIVGVTISIVKIDGYTGQRFCWLSTEGNVIWAFVGPALVIIFVNFIILTVAVRKMMNRQAQKNDVIQQGKYLARALCVILPITGLAWVFGVFAINSDLIAFQYLFAICNSLQGVFIFVFHCCTANVKAAFRDMRKRFNRRSMSKSSSFPSGSLYRTKSTEKPASPDIVFDNPNYTLSLKTLRKSEDAFSPQALITRSVAVPGIFDPGLDQPKQRLIQENSLSEPGSPTSAQQFNFGYNNDTARRRVAFSVDYTPDAAESGYESIGPGTQRRKKSISFVGVDPDRQNDIGRRTLAMDVMYNAEDEIVGFQPPRSERSGETRQRWQRAFDAIDSARTFKLSSPSSTLTRGINFECDRSEPSYFEYRL